MVQGQPYDENGRVETTYDFFCKEPHITNSYVTRIIFNHIQNYPITINFIVDSKSISNLVEDASQNDVILF